MGNQGYERPHNQDRAELYSPEENELDRELDAGLAKYAAVVPRDGLEERVLANLRVERRRMATHGWWRWGLAAALTAMVIVSLAVWWKSKPTKPTQIATRPLVLAPAPPPPAYEGAHHDASTGAARPTAPVRGKTPPSHKHMQVANPKLDQFPSPRPLSEQERILASYISADPQHAALIAEARMEALRRDREEEMREVGTNSSGDSQVR